MLTNKPETGVTVEAMTKELTDLEADYRSRRKALRALLAVLKTEAEKSTDEGEGDA